MPLGTGEVIHDRYRLVKLLGEGGFGAVYRAWDIRLDRSCALKVNTETSPDAQRQFEREAKILSGLRHSNLPQVTDYFILPGEGQYLVMDLIEGEDLQEMLDRLGHPLPEADAVRWIGQVCNALAYMHSQTPPVIHRDVKPANIKITPEGKAVLVDFGIAKVYRDNTDTTMGARAVTPGYSPQEQYGSGITDARSDIYALGATLYTILTGEEPPESVQRSLGEVDILVPPRKLNPKLNSRTETAILRAMQTSPNKRFQAVTEFKTALVAPVLPAQGTYPPVAGKVIPPSPSVQPAQSASPAARVSPAATPPVPTVSPQSSRFGSVPLRHLAVAGTVLALGVCLAAVALRGRFFNFGLDPTATQIAVVVAATPTHVLLRPTATLKPTNVSATVVVTATPVRPTATATMSPSPTSYPSPTTTGSPVPIQVVIATQVSEKDGMVLVYVPAGEFLMGLPDSVVQAGDDEKPGQSIELDEFWIDQTEVTNYMYTLCVQARACQPPSNNRLFDDSQYGSHPVVKVPWAFAQKYCEWAGRRLPTEAEWEKAARGTDGRMYPWGDLPPAGNLLNYCDSNCLDALKDRSVDDGYAETAPVGSYPAGASPYGVLDMAGNVWEWVADWYSASYYTISPSQNPLGPSSGTERVVRGSNWYTPGQDLRVTIRHSFGLREALNSLGFRCAR